MQSNQVPSDQLAEDPGEQVIVANKYILQKKIGKGSFGDVYRGYNKDSLLPVAIKIELAKTFQTRALFEGKVLSKLQGHEGIPLMYHCGTEGDYNVIVLEMLGPNLEDLLLYCQKDFSIKTVLMVADQLLLRMEQIHNRGFIHRDIKSDNFLIGSKDFISRIYAIDFGLSKRYLNPNTGEHSRMKKHKGLIGTARFASINAHLGVEQSRRDDLFSLGYLLVYLAKGKLPWQNIKAKKKKQKYKKIMEMKDNYPPETLCIGLPESFSTYLNCVKRLEFEEKPDYDQLRKLFTDTMTELNLENDQIYDWMLPKGTRQSRKHSIKQIRQVLQKGQSQENNNIPQNPKKSSQECLQVKDKEPSVKNQDSQPVLEHQSLVRNQTPEFLQILPNNEEQPEQQQMPIDSPVPFPNSLVRLIELQSIKPTSFKFSNMGLPRIKDSSIKFTVVNSEIFIDGDDFDESVQNKNEVYDFNAKESRLQTGKPFGALNIQPRKCSHESALCPNSPIARHKQQRHQSPQMAYDRAHSQYKGLSLVKSHQVQPVLEESSMYTEYQDTSNYMKYIIKHNKNQIVSTQNQFSTIQHQALTHEHCQCEDQTPKEEQQLSQNQASMKNKKVLFNAGDESNSQQIINFNCEPSTQQKLQSDMKGVQESCQKQESSCSDEYSSSSSCGEHSKDYNKKTKNCNIY